MTKKELEVLNKIKKKCEEAEDCSTCEYNDLSFGCAFNRDFPMNWNIKE